MPDVPGGTSAERLVEVEAVTCARVVLKATTLCRTALSKLLPVIVTDVPGDPMLGVNPLMDGTLDAATVNGEPLVAEPFGLVMVIGPVEAPVGTVATIVVGVAEVIVAVTPLNRTVFWPAVGLKPIPWMLTDVPTGPVLGSNSMMEVEVTL